MFNSKLKVYCPGLYLFLLSLNAFVCKLISVYCSRWSHSVIFRRKESRPRHQVMSQSRRWTRRTAPSQRLRKVLFLSTVWYSQKTSLLGRYFGVLFLVLCVCSVFLEQPEKNGDGGEPKTTAAAVSGSAFDSSVFCQQWYFKGLLYYFRI